MRKTILLVCIFLSTLLTGCESRQELAAENTTRSSEQAYAAEEDAQAVDSLIGVLEVSEIPTYNIHEIKDKDEYYWESENSPFLHDCLADVETASSVAKLIFSEIQREGYCSGYSLQYIEYQSDPGIWVFTFWDGSDDSGPSATFSMAIRKDNAQVVKMWVDE